MSRDALVVGINTYTHLRKLTAPAADAEAIAQILHSQGNFGVVRRFPEIMPEGIPQVAKTKAISLKELKTALAQLFNPPKGKQLPELALFYFSGHGVLDDTGFDEGGYLATSDTNPAQGNFGLSLQELRKLLERSPIQQQVVILDCCHAGAFVSLTDADPGDRSQGKSRCFIAASRDIELAYEGVGTPHSELTQVLLRGLDAAQGDISSDGLVAYVRQAFKGTGTIQVPVCSTVGEAIPLTFAANVSQSVPTERVAKGRSPSWVPRQIPPLPAHFVERPEHQDPLKEKLLCSDSRVKGTLVVSAIYGLGGIGKSVLAAKLAHDEEVQAHFTDGILWVTLGQNPDILPLLGGWIQELQDRDYQPITVEGTSNHLRTLLYDKKMLLVVDDVWNPEHLEPFRVGGSECRVLVTTREAKISDAQRYDLNVMTPEQAMELLTQKFPGTLSDQAQQQVREFAERVGYLPLALELAAAQVEEGVTWAELLEDFGEEVARLESLDYQDAGTVPEDAKRRKYSLLACFNLSLRLLSPEQLRQFAWLGVLPEDVSVGQEMAATLWEVTPRQAGAALRLFRGKALMLPGAVEGGDRPTYRMHDLMHDLAKRLLCQPVEPVQESDLPGLGLTVLEAHQILLERYRVKTKDGLWHTLTDDGYIFAQLTWHMEQAEWFEAVHKLLREEIPKGRNGWFEACDALGKPGIFVSDVGRAWRLAEVKAEEELSEAVVLLWRYALIRASLNSLAQNIPPELIAALVEKGVWQPAQGLAYVQQTQKPDQRASGIVQLAPLLPQVLIPEALAVTRQIQHESDRVRGLSALAPYLPELWDEASALTGQIQNEYDRVRALSALAPHLPELLDEALALTRQIQHDFYRASALRALVPHLPERLLDEALALTRQIQHKFYRPCALGELAPHLPELWDEALALTRQMPDEYDRATVLSVLTPHLPERLLDEALAMSRQMQHESNRARVLSVLTPHLPERWDEALALTRQIQHEYRRAEALRKLAPYLPKRLLNEALALTRQIQDEYFRAEALRELAPHLPERWDEVLAMMRQIQDEYYRVYALSALIPHLPQLWDEALAVTRQIQHDFHRASALSSLAPHLPELWDEALAVTRQVQDESYRARVLSEIAPHLPELLDEALAMACQIHNEHSRSFALSKLAPHLPERLLDEALKVTRQIPNEVYRVYALSALAPHLPELWNEALGVTRQIWDDSSRVHALSVLAPHMPELWDEALGVTRQIWDDSSRARALSVLTPHLPEQLLDEAWTLNSQLKDSYYAAHGMSGFLERLDYFGNEFSLWSKVINVLAYRNRQELIHYFLKLRKFIITLSSENTLWLMVEAMNDVCRQWP